MAPKFLGLPLPVWGSLCVVIGIIWVFVWPSARATPTESVRFIILRWFHALVWLLLALAAFIAGFNILDGPKTAKPIALLSLVVYLIFMATFISSKKVL